MSSHPLRVLLVSLMLAFLLFAFGCDEPNKADIPPQPYHLVSITTTRGVASGVDVDGNYAAVAEGEYGAVVFDISSAAQPVQIFHDSMPGLPSNPACQLVAIKNFHHQVLTDVNGTSGSNVLHNFLTGHQTTPGTGVPFSSQQDKVKMYATADSILFFCADHSVGDGLQSQLLHRVDDSTWTVDLIYSQLMWSTRAGVYGFDRRPDNIIAVAANEDGLHIHDANTFTGVSDLVTLGAAYDCAWYGNNYIIVADRYRVTIVDASDITHPFIASSLVIPGADRMSKLVLDGPYALMLDELDGVYVVDISNPLAPKHIQSMKLDEPLSIDAQNGVVCVADAQQGLVIYAR